MEKHFKLITPVYNAEKWIGKCIQSVKDQTYSNFTQIIVDDCSTDETITVAKEAIGEDPRFVIIEKEEKTGTLHGHILAGEHNYSEDDFFVHLDGDDWFSDENVLSRLNRIYDDENIWCTYGNYETTDDSLSVNKHVNECLLYWQTGEMLGKAPLLAKNWENDNCTIAAKTGELEEDEYDASFRLILASGWFMSQIRSFRGKLWRGLEESDFKTKDGSYFAVADVAVFVPVLEMAGFDRVKYVPEIQMIYNRETPFNDDKVHRELVVSHAKELSRKTPKRKWKS